MNIEQYCCKNDHHLDIDNMYCGECRITFCLKCEDRHATHRGVAKFDGSLVESLVKESKEVIDQWDVQNEAGQIDAQNRKREKMEREYDSQMDSISKTFRELHDLLHIKEVELKRELRSYHEENMEMNATEVSRLEASLNTSLDLLNLYNSQLADITQSGQDSLCRLYLNRIIPFQKSREERDGERVKLRMKKAFIKDAEAELLEYATSLFREDANDEPQEQKTKVNYEQYKIDYQQYLFKEDHQANVKKAIENVLLISKQNKKAELKQNHLRHEEEEEADEAYDDFIFDLFG